ncbi:MAG: hypothetical protein ACK5QX_01935, partial [bacterium]
MLPASSTLEAAADDDFDAPSWSRTPSPFTCPATEITTNVVLGMHTTPLLSPSVLEASSLSERIEPNADPIPSVAASGSALGASVCDAPGVDVCEPHAISCPVTLNPVAQSAGFSSFAHARPPPFSLDPATGAGALPPIGPLLNVGPPPQPGAEALPPIGPLLNVGLPPQPGALAHGPSSFSNPHAQAYGPGLDTGAAARTNTRSSAQASYLKGAERLVYAPPLPIAVSTSACQLACTNPPPKTEAFTCLHLPPNDRSHASGASLVEGEPLADHYPPAGCTDSPADASPIGLEEAIVHMSGPPTSTSPITAPPASVVHASSQST